MIIVSMKDLAHCEDLQGHVLVTLRDSEPSFSFPLQVMGEGWKTPESKQVICGPGNHPLGTRFSPLQAQAGDSSKRGASAEHPV